MINLIDQGIRSALENSNYQIEFYRESFDTVQFPDSGEQQQFREFFIRKYRNHQPDLIITVGQTPLSFMIDSHEKYFAGVPIVFCLPARIPADLALHPEFTGLIGGETGFALTVVAALQLKPETKHLAVVGGRAPYDRQQQAMIRAQLKVYEERLDISYLTELTAPQLQEHLSHLPNDAFVLMSALGEDAAGTKFTSVESGPMVVKAANVPVFRTLAIAGRQNRDFCSRPMPGTTVRAFLPLRVELPLAGQCDLSCILQDDSADRWPLTRLNNDQQSVGMEPSRKDAVIPLPYEPVRSLVVYRTG